MYQDVGENPYLTSPATESIEFEHLYLFRLPTREALKILPSFLKPLEIGQGHSALALGIQLLSSTSFSKHRDIQKIYLGLGVHARYDLQTATPRFAFFLPHMYTNQEDVSNSLIDINKVEKHCGTGLEVAYDFENLKVSAKDHDGPIFRLQATTPPQVYRKVEVWGQSHTVLAGKHYIQTNLWKGEAYEHMGTPMAGELFNHPLFLGLNVEGVGSQCYHQMMMKPHADGLMTLFKPVPQK